MIYNHHHNRPSLKRVNVTAGELRKSGIEVIGSVPWGTHFANSTILNKT
jgi:hypothetical protein